MSRHTPGPWVVDVSIGVIRAILPDGEREQVATMRATCVTDRWEADAHLIAASPDLLEALKAIEDDYKMMCDEEDEASEGARLLRKVRDAIAKAEGRQ